MRHLAPGYYVVVPQRRIGDLRWRPDLHAVALGIAVADYGTNAVALMGTSAARHYGVLPRAVAVAVVAAPLQRPALRLGIGEIVFVRRTFERLDTERVDTELVSGWVTTVEQTLLDLADRPTLGGMTAQSSEEAVRALAIRADWDRVAELARRQRKARALRAALAVAGRGSDAGP